MFPNASLPVTVKATVEPAVAVAGPETANVVAGPGWKVTVVPTAIGARSTVPLIDATPATVDEVRVAV